ncbi:Uncharacterized membrane protein [Aquimarina spongiae]|uniref:Uncharacterized membrane protein n=2 Tax=Aquimarina spongiae TaxID=570521 RepID=A0A1M6GMW5_9FLAO|nr:Uncharacterized membrane protein [Aquimarina spongiae]
MVMVVLNQASTNFSPRLLPGLISNKRHQIILGFYIGTLLFNIIVLMSLGAYGPSKNAVGFSVMISAILGAFCVGLFVYFIHSISQAIQIQNIIDKIFYKSDKLLDAEKRRQEESADIPSPENSTEDWKIIQSGKSGYYRSFDVSLLGDSFKQQEKIIEIIPYADQHVWKNDPIMKVREELSTDEIEALQLSLYILSNPHEDDSSISGMIKLTEVVVKALSPGINDPGTAINAISKIGQLLSKALTLKPKTLEKRSDLEMLIVHQNIPARELMRIIVQPIREYAKMDCAVAYELMSTLIYVWNTKNICTDYITAISDEIKALQSDLKANIGNHKDLKRILELVE